MRRLSLLTIMAINLFAAAVAYAGTIHLGYITQSRKLSGYANFFENNTILRVVSREGHTGENTLRSETFHRLSMEQELLIQPQTADMSLYTIKSRTIREETEKGLVQQLVNHKNQYLRYNSGQSKQNFNFSNLAHISLPLIFPDHDLEVGAKWSNNQDIQVDDLPVIPLTIMYHLTDVRRLAGKEIAEVNYTISAEIKTTELTDDVILLQKIDLLRSRGIEKLAVSGSGKIAFNLNDHLTLVHNMDFVIEISERIITAQTRELRERIRELHKAEVLIPL